ncbi:MAG: thymidylate kinase [bacterium]|jgi:thymidylate kinase
MNPFIVFEGKDGAGKTTLADLMANKLNLDLLESVPENFKDMRKIIESTSSPTATLLFFALANLKQSFDIRQKLNTKGVVLDRFIYSTLAYHSFLLNDDLSFLVSMFKNDPKFLWPDVIVMVTADQETIQKRIGERDTCQWNGDAITLKHPLMEGYKKAFLVSPEIPVIQIDTTNLLPDDALEELCTRLKKLNHPKFSPLL